MVTSGFMVIVVISGYTSGFQWFPVVTRDRTWSPVVFMVIVVISGYQWLSLVSCGYQRLCMVTSGFYGYHGYQWFPVVTRDCVWSPVVFMVIMVISGYQHTTGGTIVLTPFLPSIAPTRYVCLVFSFCIPH